MIILILAFADWLRSFVDQAGFDFVGVNSQIGELLAPGFGVRHLSSPVTFLVIVLLLELFLIVCFSGEGLEIGGL